MPGGDEAAPRVPSPGRDRRFLTFLGGAAAADIGDQAWIVILAYAAAQSGSAVTATLTVAAGTVPRAILELVGGAVADRLPTRPLVVSVAGARVLALAAGLLALIALPEHSIFVIVGIAVLFGAADALHKPAIFTMPRQIVGVDHVVRAASLRQLVNRMALLGGPALAGAVLAAVALPGAVAGLLAIFLLAAVLLSLVRVRFRREEVQRESVLASLRSVVEFLRADHPSRALVYSMIGLNFFVIPVLNVGVALKAHQEGWSAQVLGILLACVGVGAALGTLVTLRIKPRHPMRFALALLVLQGFALALVGLLPMVGVGISLALVGLTAGLASPMMAGTAQAIVPSNYIGRVFAVVGVADDALIPFALVGYGVVADRVGLSTTTVICGIGMAVLMGIGLLRRPLRNLRLDQPGDEAAGSDRPEGESAPEDPDDAGDDPRHTAEPAQPSAPRRGFVPRHGVDARQLTPPPPAALPDSEQEAYEPAPGRRSRLR
jgi:MFS family permease